MDPGPARLSFDLSHWTLTLFVGRPSWDMQLTLAVSPGTFPICLASVGLSVLWVIATPPLDRVKHQELGKRWFGKGQEKKCLQLQFAQDTSGLWEKGHQRGGSPLPSTQDLERSGEVIGRCTAARRVSGEKGLLVDQKPAASELSCCATAKATYARPGASVTQTCMLSPARGLILTRHSQNLFWIHSPCHFTWKPFYKEEDVLHGEPQLGLIWHLALFLHNQKRH